MKKIGVTGGNGFVGSHLINTLSQFEGEFTLVEFERSYFENQDKLESFVKECDVIVHLAALNRHESQEFIYEKNLSLTRSLCNALENTGARPHVIISSSSQEKKDNLYGRSKRESRELLETWASENNAIFTGAVVPNVFGAFCKPNYNSFIATFCSRLIQGEKPEIQVDAEVQLIYVQELVNTFISEIRNEETKGELLIPYTTAIKVSDVLTKLENFHQVYFQGGNIPVLKSDFEINLFNTFRSYIDLDSFFPRKFVQHTDDRGSFVELIRLGIGGQVSFSTTVPGVTRGNHYHTRKIERFAVIKGKALIEMRKIGTKEVLSFELNGEEPAYVDMPIWYTHNIKNIGDEILYTNFWINEAYDPENPDTYFVTV